ncbi:hypothetical protein EJB05_40718, partial [Eragrostis curvula]
MGPKDDPKEKPKEDTMLKALVAILDDRFGTTNQMISALQGSVEALMVSKGEFEQWKPEMEKQVGDLKVSVSLLQETLHQVGPISSTLQDPAVKVAVDPQSKMPAAAHRVATASAAASGPNGHRVDSYHRGLGFGDDFPGPTPVTDPNIHVGVAHALVRGLGFAGAAASASVSLWVSCLMLAAYVRFSERFRDTWCGPTAEAFRHVLPGLKLAIPFAVMVWSVLTETTPEPLDFQLPEEQTQEVQEEQPQQDTDPTDPVAPLSLTLRVEVDSGIASFPLRYTDSILRKAETLHENTQAVSYMITYGFAAVISTRVSNELGAGNINNAKKALTVSLSLSLLLAVAFLLLLGLGHDLWASLFSNSETVVSAFASMTPLLIGSVVLDSTQGVLSGVARGCGWQHMAAWTNLVAFYIVGLPLALLFGFTLGLNIKGLWLGQICGLLCQNCVLLFITLRTNWEKIDLTTLNQENDFFC